MKKFLCLSLIPLLFSLNVVADDVQTAWKSGGVFASSSVIGATLGGPIGMVVGALGGAWLGEQIRTADQVPELEQQLLRSTEQAQARSSQIDSLQNELGNMAGALASRLEFQVLFSTGNDELQDPDIERLRMLSSYLLRNPTLQVRLDGYADPRGTDEYNNVLAMYRARNVAQALNELGVPKSRILIFHHGAKVEPGLQADLDSFALQRRVDIQVYQPEQVLTASADR